ncbi:MAG: hypothetical protein IJ233_02930, partial [Pyramidobacter sp.]|nr:hypothetical protein [Pyramidobacter sp.]
LRTTDCDGFNVTIPYKMDVMRSCAQLTSRARAIGCVNTMTRLPGGGWRGDNTDWDGFMALLGDVASEFYGRPALVLGSGGASKTAQAALKECGIPFTVISRSGPDNYGNLERRADAELVVNTTPIGMYPHNGESPVDLRAFPRLRLVLDVIYNPARTALMLQADELGIPARGGLLMLAGQGVRAAELFLGRDLPAGLTEEIAAKISCSTRNIALIGLPGCGKTTTARNLGKMTARPVYDIDAMIAEREGMPIPRIFAERGEAAFRAIETEVLAEVSKLSGAVIATGGGVVTQSRNRPLLRQNSTIVFLDREDGLAVEGRPLSQQRGLETLKRERLSLYRTWADRTVRSGANAHETAKKIKEALQL